MPTEVGKFRTGQTEWTVTVDHQIFYGNAPGMPTVHGESWEVMENNAKVQASKAKIRVSIPYVIMGWDRGKPVVRHRTATGLHSANGNVLYTDAAGSGQETGYEEKLMPLSPEHEKEYLALAAQVRELESRLREIQAEYKFPMGGLKKTIQATIDAEHKRREEASQA